MPVTLTQSSVVASTLTATVIAITGATYPGVYPGATTYPGRGNSVSGSAVSVTTLVGTAA